MTGPLHLVIGSLSPEAAFGGNLLNSKRMVRGKLGPWYCDLLLSDTVCLDMVL